MVDGSVVPGDLLASVSGALVVAIFYLARQIARLGERIAKLEGQLEAERDARS